MLLTTSLHLASNLRTGGTVGLSLLLQYASMAWIGKSGVSAAMLSPRGAKKWTHNTRVVCVSSHVSDSKLQTCSQEFSGSNLGPDTGYPDWNFFSFSSVPPNNWETTIDTTDSFQFFSSPSFTCHFVMDFAQSETMTALQNKQWMSEISHYISSQFGTNRGRGCILKFCLFNSVSLLYTKLKKFYPFCLDKACPRKMTVTPKSADKFNPLKLSGYCTYQRV